MGAAETTDLLDFDPSLVEESLRLTPEQRAIQHQEALNLALELERAGKELRDRLQSTASTSRLR